MNYGSSRKGRSNMSEIIRINENSKNLADRCRITLEKSWGMKIPTPKCLN
jgi:hypothetical protein